MLYYKKEDGSEEVFTEANSFQKTGAAQREDKVIFGADIKRRYLSGSVLSNDI
jgi:hypothetical protein